MAALAQATLILGRTFGRLFLPAISLYFLALGPGARAASAAYLRRVLGRPAQLWEIYRHLYTFAATIHDRVLLLAGRMGDFDLTIEGEELIHAALAEHRRGCLLFGAHLGSFEVLRAIAARRQDVRVWILMETENAVRIQSVLRRVQPAAAERVVPIGEPNTLLSVKECLERGEVVGILADRVWRQDRASEASFLGARVRFPLGPFRLAAALGAPVVFGVGLYEGGSRYALHFERIDRLDDRDLPDRTASQLMLQYVARLEHYCRLAPYNWFNFYDFWSEYD